MGDSLHNGLTLNTSTGLISGVSQEVGSRNLQIQVQDADGVTSTKTLTLTVNRYQITNPGSLPDGIRGEVYASTTCSTDGGISPITWSYASGSLHGLTLDSLNAASGIVHGTPTSAGSGLVTFRAEDAYGNWAELVYSLNITETTIDTVSLPAGYFGTYYDTTALSVSGGKAPYTWSKAGGSSYLDVHASGAIVGTLDDYSPSIILRATDANGITKDKSFNITVLNIDLLSLTKPVYRNSGRILATWTPESFGALYYYLKRKSDGSWAAFPNESVYPDFIGTIMQSELYDGDAGFYLSLNYGASARYFANGYVGTSETTAQSMPYFFSAYTESVPDSSFDTEHISQMYVYIKSESGTWSSYLMSENSYRGWEKTMTWPTDVVPDEDAGHYFKAVDIAGRVIWLGSTNVYLTEAEAQSNTIAYNLYVQSTGVGFYANANRLKELQTISPIQVTITLNAPLPEVPISSWYGSSTGTSSADTGLGWGGTGAGPGGAQFGWTGWTYTPVTTPAGRRYTVVTDEYGTTLFFVAGGRTYDNAQDATAAATIPVEITTESLPFARRNRDYGPVQLEARGGVPPYYWRISSGDLRGLTLDAETGIISGRARSSGRLTIVVEVLDLESRVTNVN